MNVLQWVLEHKWAITPTALNAIIEIANRDHEMTTDAIAKAIHGSAWERYLDNKGNVLDFQALEANNYNLLEGTRRVSIAGKTAILPVVGPIFPRANLMSMSGGTSLQSLSYDFNVALESKEVDSIILNIDSPGGEVTGISEFADMIYKANKQKSIIAYVYGLGASAAYWIASASSEIVMATTGEAGSIGVVAGYTDRKKQKEKSGVSEIEIVSSQSPYKRPDPSTSEGRLQIQEVVDQIAGVFIKSVALHRGVSSQDVVDSYGQGKMFVGEDAVQRGLADRVSTLETLIEEQNTINSGTDNNLFLGGEMDVKTLKAEHPDVYAEVIALGKAEAESDVNARIEVARLEGAENENARIKEIESINVPGAKKVIAENKFDRTKTADGISTLILKSQQEQMEAMGADLDKDGQDLANLANGVGTDIPVNSDDAESKAAIDAMIVGIEGYQR
jgi:signal peptide peptidase SppA